MNQLTPFITFFACMSYGTLSRDEFVNHADLISICNSYGLNVEKMKENIGLLAEAGYYEYASDSFPFRGPTIVSASSEMKIEEMVTSGLEPGFAIRWTNEGYTLVEKLSEAYQDRENNSIIAESILLRSAERYDTVFKMFQKVEQNFKEVYEEDYSKFNQRINSAKEKLGYIG